MRRDELLAIADETFKKCKGILDCKNHDYSKGEEDALRNFKMVENFRLTDMPTGVLVRLCDKFSRIANLIHSEAKVKDETIEDTIDDAINYLIIFKATLHERKQQVHNG
jgi:hypothetical protein